MIHNNLFDTNPLIVHAQGKIEFSPLWEKILVKPIPIVLDNRLDIITWNSGKRNNINCNKTLGTFEKSCELFGFTPTVLGKDYGSRWYNRLKIDCTIKYLSTSRCLYTMGCDSSDVLLLGNPNDILGLFLEMDCDLLFNAELVYWPEKPDLREFEEKIGIGPFFYFNSGVWIGRTDFCLEFYKKAKEYSDITLHNPFSEQVCTKQAYKEFYPKVKVDHTCKVFQTLNRVFADMLSC